MSHLSETELQRFHAHETDSEQTTRIRAHLAGCPDCSQRSAKLLGTSTTTPETLTSPATTQTKGSPARPESDHVGPYRLLEKIGEGGMGIVYLAEQSEPIRRRVALKIIKLGMDTRLVVARFEAERQALAMMDHPYVAKVFDAGATAQGRPYFVMEHVQGEPITDYCDRHRLTTTARLELFIAVCQAVQHAHQKAIIHRDLKPSNILVTVKDGKAIPKVIDFGVAKATEHKLTERTLFTEQGQLIGTPEYMSPEQAEMSALNIDTRTDIYSLGVVLYELLVGTLPFDSRSLRQAAFNEIQRIIREVDPPKPSTRLSSLGASSTQVAQKRRTEIRALSRILRGDLDWVVMKCLEKDRNRRYQTAEGLAREIVNYLTDRPVLAGPPGWPYRLRKFVRRNRGPVAATTLIAVVLIAATGVSLRARGDAEQARGESEQRAAQLKVVTEFQQSMLSNLDPETMGRGIIANQRDSIRQGILNDGGGPEETEAALTSFYELARHANATDLALAVVEENVLARAEQTLLDDFANEPVLRATLEQTLADTCREIGLYESALRLQEAALRTRRQVLGNEHADTLMSVNNMGLLHRILGQHDEAFELYSEALQVRRRVFGNDDLGTLQSLTNFGTFLVIMGEADEAEPYLQDAVAGYRRMLGSDHPDTLTAINNLARMCEAQGQHNESLTYYQEALDGRRRVLGDDHPDTLVSINNMAFMLGTMGRRDDALPYYRESLDRSRRVLGNDHRTTLGAINNMGSVLREMGRTQEAEKYYREALAGHRRTLGDTHPNTLTSINNMGTLLLSMGKYDEALPYFHEALAGKRRQFGNDHLTTLISIHNLGRLMRDLKRLEEAEALGAEASQGARAHLPSSHPFRFGAIAAYGETLTALEEFGEAEEHLLEAHAGFLETSGPQNKRTVQVVRSLVVLYDAWHAVSPDNAYDATAAQWRSRLEQVSQPVE